MIHGSGEYSGADGRVYRGSWRDSMMHGAGVYEWPDGRVYEGEYVKDKKHGFGIFTWRDGRRYEGFWCDSLQHGLGYLHQPSGSCRLALWERGKRTRWITDHVDIPNGGTLADRPPPERGAEPNEDLDEYAHRIQ